MQQNGRALQAAEKPGPEGGGGFNPRIKPQKQSGPSGPEGCFSAFSLEIIPYPQLVTAIPGHQGGKSKTRERSLRLRSLVCSRGLPPVAFNQHPFPMAVNPMMRNPACALMGRTIPAARCPDVVVPFPAVITGNPHVSPLRRRTPLFVDGRRRRDTNRNLRKRGRRNQRKSKQNCPCNLLHSE